MKPAEPRLAGTERLSFEDKRLRGTKRQRDCDIGLFAELATHQDLIDLLSTKPRKGNDQ